MHVHLRNIKLLIAWVGTKTARYRPINHPGWYIILSLTVRKEKREKIWEIRSEGEMLFKQQSKGTQEIMAYGSGAL